MLIHHSNSVWDVHVHIAWIRYESCMLIIIACIQYRIYMLMLPEFGMGCACSHRLNSVWVACSHHLICVWEVRAHIAWIWYGRCVLTSPEFGLLTSPEFRMKGTCSHHLSSEWKVYAHIAWIQNERYMLTSPEFSMTGACSYRRWKTSR